MTKEVLSLLRYKNRGLKKFLDRSKEFGETAKTGDFSGLDRFQEDRDAIIRAIELFDRKLVEFVTLMSDADRTPEFIDRVRESLEQEEALKASILEADAAVQALIAEERDRIAREIQNERKRFESIEKFKTDGGAAGPNGEGFDRTL